MSEDYHAYELSNEPEYPTKNPNRVSGGKKAAAHFTHEQLSERAQQAADTRAMRDTQSHSGSRPPYSKAAVKRHQQRHQQAGEQEDEDEDGEEKEKEEDEEQDEEHEQAEGGGYRQRSITKPVAGSKGSAGSRAYSTRSHDDMPALRSQDKKKKAPMEDWQRFELENEPEYPTKNPNRVAAGKRAAAKAGHDELSARAQQAAETRALRESGSHSGSRPAYSKATVQRHNQRQNKRGQEEEEDGADDEEDEQDGEDEEDEEVAEEDNSAETRSRMLSKPARKHASTGKGKAKDYHAYELSNEPEYPTKNPNRVSGGKKAAAHFTHEQLSERAQQAADTRAMRDTQSHSGSRPPYSKAAVKRHQQRHQQAGGSKRTRTRTGKRRTRTRTGRQSRQARVNAQSVERRDLPARCMN